MIMNLAIKGHPTRGGEVIQLLEMLGGKIRCDRLAGNEIFSWYYINGNGFIDYMHYSLFYDYDTIVFTLEEFEKFYPYKVGDKVEVLKTGKIYTISQIMWNGNEIIYVLSHKGNKACWFSAVNELKPHQESKCLTELKEYLNNMTPEQLEEDWKKLEKFSEVELVANEYVKQCKEDNKAMGSRIDFSLTERIELELGDTHEVVVENGKTYVVKKKPQYPKDYEECCEVLMGKTDFQDFELVLTKLSTNINEENSISPEPPYINLINNFYKLRICLDAYWKIAGKEMGLDKPWKFDMFKDEFVYVIVYQYGYIQKCEVRYKNYILAFPTAEMRDAFYENFKELIEECKELL